MGLTTKEVLELIRAGYTKAEIDAMVAPEGTPAPEQGTAGKQTPESSGENKPDSENSADRGENSGAEPKPENRLKSDSGVQVQSEVEKLVSALGMKLDTLTRAVVGRNIGGIEGHTPTPEETAESIVARIINPHINETEGGK